MNKVIEGILNEIDRDIRCVLIDFENETWREAIPSESGWYFIKTTTPIEVLRCVKPPSEEHKAHINIPETIYRTLRLQGIAITQREKSEYVVYNGEALNLKARAREHEHGHAKTYCLGLSNYTVLRNYKWCFCYIAAQDCELISNDNKLLRVVVEQAWRAKNGWPILCRK
jgi:hypothetical protein